MEWLDRGAKFARETGELIDAVHHEGTAGGDAFRGSVEHREIAGDRLGGRGNLCDALVGVLHSLRGFGDPPGDVLEPRDVEALGRKAGQSEAQIFRRTSMDSVSGLNPAYATRR